MLAKIPQAKREALASFGNDELLVERYVENPRHIEVQVIADSHGAVVHLGERECSLQRRHQKVIEEAPSPLLTAETRARIGEAACETARSVGYRGAGTVEFIVGADNPDEFFFIEMNTRLQVEHPVTEMVTGIDLVEWQVRVGAGEALGFAQSDIVLRGHAIEARVYAEDVPAGFLPSGGRVLELHEASGEGIRVDSALIEGQRVSSDYDPMLAKVIAWSSDRAGALATAQQALSQTSVFGVTTNIEFLSRLLDHPAVQRGELDTGLIERELDLLVPPEASDEALIAAALELRARSSRAIAKLATVSGPWRSLSGFRIGQQAPAVFVFEVDGAADGASPATRQRRLAVWDANRGRVPGASGHSTESFRVRIDDGDDQEITVFRDENLPGRVTIRVNDSVASWRVRADDKGVWVQRGTQVARLDLARRDVGALAGSDAVPELRSPMPGTVVQLAVADGDHVEAGDTIVVVEAMKMEHVLAAHAAGLVRLHATLGASVERHAVLATLELDSDPKDSDSKDIDQQDSAESGSNDSKNDTAEQGQQ
ncbi:biotin/lipoyl-containing protein [Humidisolicoccus flavus]